MTSHFLADEISSASEAEICARQSVKEVDHREQIVLNHLWQVTLIVRQMKAHMPAWASIEDLQAAGLIGLLQAVDQYDPQYSSTLRTFAEYKIRSAILDSLRALDWASRTHRKHIRLHARAKAKLEQRLQRLPTAEELATELEMTVADYYTALSTSQELALESLDQLAAEYEDDSKMRCLADSDARWPSHLAERAEMEGLLQQAVGTLPERERTVLRLYYYEELTLIDIANRMNVGESRVSQLKAQAVQRLRRCLFAESPRQYTSANADSAQGDTEPSPPRKSRRTHRLPTPADKG